MEIRPLYIRPVERRIALGRPAHLGRHHPTPSQDRALARQFTSEGRARRQSRPRSCLSGRARVPRPARVRFDQASACRPSPVRTRPPPSPIALLITSASAMQARQKLRSDMAAGSVTGRPVTSSRTDGDTAQAIPKRASAQS